MLMKIKAVRSFPSPLGIANHPMTPWANEEEAAAIAAFRAKMQTAEAKQIYRQRGAVAEFPSAWIKAKMGLRQIHLRGLRKVKIEVVWACLTYNLQHRKSDRGP